VLRDDCDMRILFSFVGGTGHFEPMVPLARAAAAAGHAVAFTCGARMVPVVERRGFAALQTVPTETVEPPERRALVPADRAREIALVRRWAGERRRHEREVGIADRAADWRADVLVADEADFACAAAADRAGLPMARVLELAPGFMPADLAVEAGLVLTPFPESWRPDAAHRYRAHEARASTGDGVYFTLGTIFPLECGDLFARVLAGLGGRAVTVSVGPDVDPAELGPQPPNVRVERHVDQAEVLPRCGVMVSHGGSGSLLAALSYGLPSVLLPMGADQPWNADRAVQLGVAEVLDPMTATPDDVRRAVAAAPGHRDAAARLQDEIARLPGPDDAVARLEAYA
jgi:UDP:flavonoid glycosyltransferase YjiC (YdhE family)